MLSENKMNKYLIRILYDTPGWAYYWRALALQRYAPQDFEVTVGSDYGKAFRDRKYDLVLQLAYNYAKDLRVHMDKSNYRFPVVSSFNVGWGYANDWLDGVIKYSDCVVINNKEMWEKAGKKERTVHISNGVDRKVFNIRVPIEKRKTKILWVGSKTHMRTKNYHAILVPMMTRLRQYGINFEFRLVDSVGKGRLDQHQMAQWYNSGTTYVVASNTEGTPNPALEAAACGLSVVSTRVGNMPELIKDGYNGYLCEKNLISLLDGVLKATKKQKELSCNMLKEIESWDWKNRSQQYFALFRKLIDERRTHNAIK